MVLRSAVAALGLILLASCASCASGVNGSPATAGSRRTLNIVVAENFWGSIVSQLAGNAGNVVSVVTDPNADPHTYEASSDDARAFAAADYVVLNGAGYDGWAEKLLSGNPNAKRKVLSVADLVGRREGDNPHFWYNPDDVTNVTDRVEADLKTLDPSDARYFDGQRVGFDAAMATNRTRLTAIRARFSGTPVAATESIFVPLAHYLDLNVISPPAFMSAVAEGNDPPVPSVVEFEHQMTSKQAKVLVYNAQTSTAVTTTMKRLAARAGIPTVGVTETIEPLDASFEQWFGAELDQLQRGLAGAAP